MARYTASFVIGSKAYVGTGYGGAGPYNKFLYEYNPLINMWTQKADFGGDARSEAIGFSLGGYGYICCGWSTVGGAHLFKDLWRYDPSGDSWLQMNDFGGIKRGGLHSFVIGNYAYIIGGDGWNTSTLKDLWRYDPSGDSWTQMADLPGTSRKKGFAFSIGNYGYICTGWYHPVAGPGHRLKDCWRYDPSGDSWTQMADFLGTARQGAVGWGDGNYGYATMGTQNGVPWYMQDGYYYDPSTNTWSAMTVFSGNGRYASTGFYVNGHGYIVGGFGAGDVIYDETWRYESEVAAKGGSSALLLFAKMLMG